MALGFGKKRSSGKPQAQQQPQASAPPAPAAWSLPADWREQLTASKPKGRFVQGQNVKGGYRR